MDYKVNALFIFICCPFSSVLRHSLAVMLTGVTWQVSIVVLVLIEVIINLVLMLMEFNVIKGNNCSIYDRDRTVWSPI